MLGKSPVESFAQMYSSTKVYSLQKAASSEHIALCVHACFWGFAFASCSVAQAWASSRAELPKPPGRSKGHQRQSMAKTEAWICEGLLSLQQ